MSELLPDLYYLHGDDEGLNYCPKCADKKAKRLQSEGEDVEAFMIHPFAEEDSPAQCDTCHTPVACSIIPEGIVLNTSGEWLLEVQREA